MKPNILVLYYSQSGQLRHILENLLQDITNKATIDYVAIEPVKPFPWPWNAYAFFDAMPETVERIPAEVKPLDTSVKEKNYDLVVLGYQPWFLNPSQPITGFLKGETASVLKGKPVVTVVGCRNMWLNGQEQVKQDLQSAGARLVGNIVLADTHTNLVSLLTVIRWSFKGQKEASGILPEAGVQAVDIKRSSRFGGIILKHLTGNTLTRLQQELVNTGAVDLDPGLVLLEQRGVKNFRYWAKFIREKGGPGDPNRRGRVLLFKRLLLTAIFVLSPLSSLTAYIKLQLKKRSLIKDVEYFKGLKYEEGRM
jgi:hypothetical protein